MRENSEKSVHFVGQDNQPLLTTSNNQTTTQKKRLFGFDGYIRVLVYNGVFTFVYFRGIRWSLFTFKKAVSGVGMGLHTL